MQIFLDDDDYRKFLFILGDMFDAYDVECWDFCVMPNHFHIALKTRMPNLSDAIRYLNSEYAMWWNARHGHVGHVFQGRFKDQIVQREGYLGSLIRYIAMNPVRAGLVTTPEVWHWSAFRCTAGLSPNPGFVSCEAVLRHFGDDNIDQLRERYVRHVLSTPEEEDVRIEEFRSRRRIIGDRAFRLSLPGVGPAPAPPPD